MEDNFFQGKLCAQYRLSGARLRPVRRQNSDRPAAAPAGWEEMGGGKLDDPSPMANNNYKIRAHADSHGHRHTRAPAPTHTWNHPIKKTQTKGRTPAHTRTRSTFVPHRREFRRNALIDTRQREEQRIMRRIFKKRSPWGLVAPTRRSATENVVGWRRRGGGWPGRRRGTGGPGRKGGSGPGPCPNQTLPGVPRPRRVAVFQTPSI